MLTIANGFLLIQDEYADFYLVQANLRDNIHRVTKIELDGQPSISLLQNIQFSESVECEDGSFYSEVSYDYFLPAKAVFV